MLGFNQPTDLIKDFCALVEGQIHFVIPIGVEVSPTLMNILAELPNPLRTMIELDVFTGLRRGELIGLRWEDVDFGQLILHVRRSVVAMVEGAPKTEASKKDVPSDAQTAESLFAWRQSCAYPAPHDWVFASPAMHGKQPYWPGTQWRDYGKPALKRPDYQARELSHVQAHLWNSSEREWREPKGCAGIASSLQSESNHGRLYASRQSAEERGPEQAGEDGHEKTASS
jgi:integrase